MAKAMANSRRDDISKDDFEQKTERLDEGGSERRQNTEVKNQVTEL